jgi:hypothetical protein
VIPSKDRWRAFGTAVLDPWVLSLGVLGGLLFKFQVQQENTQVAAALNLMLIIVSGVLGGLLTNRWSELSGERAVVAQGKAAVRGLKLLLGSISALDRRVREYLKRMQDGDAPKAGEREIVRTYLEEVAQRCVVLEEEALSSIENWIGIVPEADVRSQIGLITRLNEELADQLREVRELELKLDEVKDKSAGEAQKFKADIIGREIEIAKLKRELQEKRINIGSVLSTGTSSYPAGVGYISPGLVGIYPAPTASYCLKCGQVFDGDKFSSCPNCSKEGGEKERSMK